MIESSRKAISDALFMTRIPSAHISAVMFGYLDVMRKKGLASDAARIAERITSHRDTVIRFHQVTKQAIILGTLRDLLADASELDVFVEQMSMDEDDSDLVTFRRGVFDMSRRLH